MPGERPEPEQILKEIKREEQKQKRGKLKIFFGYSAGVGKTYAMLEAAHAARDSGVEVVVGYIEPHARPATMALLEGLECLPHKKIEHKGITLREFDLDGALQRRPQLILVDELAHTNAPGCRHIKRYQDVEELLNAGIHVYTTVNVQHIESLNDIVASITGITVRERIPDKVFDAADQVELVDIEPEELIQRLHEGKIYREGQAKRALDHFFTADNLVSLREIALRRTADRVNKISERSKQTSLHADYYAGEHILICLSAAPSNEKVIRTAARMADAFRGSFTALFVETPGFADMSEENRKRLRSNLKLAERLGAKIATVYGDDVAGQIAEFARYSGVSKIILGRTNTKRKFLFTKPSFADRLIDLAPNLDVYIIPDKVERPYREKRSKIRWKEPYTFSLKDMLKSVGILVASTLVGFLFQWMGFSEANIIMVYILGVLFTAVVTSRRIYSLVSSVFSVLVFNFFFTHPYFSLEAYDPGYPITFVVMFLVALLSGSLTTRIKKQAKQEAGRAYRTKILLETNQKLQQAEDGKTIIQATANQLLRLLRKTILFYPAGDADLLPPQVFDISDGVEDTSVYLNPNEKAVAEWVYKNNKHAGATTNTLSGAKCLYLAVRGNERVYGVVGIALQGEELEPFENSLMISMLGECALALEKEALNESKKQAAVQAQQEQLRANLLRSISHDLRSPLTSISGNAGVLLNSSERMEEAQKKKLYTDIYDDSLWLINLVENLLSVTRIEDGTMHLHMEAEMMEDVITEALRHINRKSIEHSIQTKLQDDMIMAHIDARLIVQVIINILDNAIKYTPIGSTISLSVYQKDQWVVTEIADNGEGIPDQEKKNLFQMFYTVHHGAADSRRGLGLGLALCKSIITAHGGGISVEDNHPKGALFRFTLPAEEVTFHE